MRSQKGQLLVLTVILLPILLIMTIFIIEAGFLYIKQSQLQDAADAIAFSGIESEDEARKLVKLNRTVDLDIDSIGIAPGSPVQLTESVKPVFHKIFGDSEITTITVYAR